MQREGLRAKSGAPSLAAPVRAPHPPQGPHPHRPLPTCGLSRFFRSRAEGPGGSGRLGHPEGFCGYGSPDPAPVLPLLHALARLLLAELAWLGANPRPPTPRSPAGVLAATSPARPSCAPSSRDLSFKRGAGHPLRYPPRDSEIRSQELRGPSAARNSDSAKLVGDLH